MTYIVKDGDEVSWSKVQEELEEEFANEDHSWYIAGTTEFGGQRKGFAVPHLTRGDHLRRWNSVVGSHNWENNIEIQKDGTYKHYISVRVNEDDDRIRLTKQGVASPGGGVEGAKTLSTHSFKRASSAWGVGQYLTQANEVFVNIYGNRSEVPEGEEIIMDQVGPKGSRETIYFARPDIEEAFESDISTSGGSPSSTAKQTTSQQNASNGTSNSSSGGDDFDLGEFRRDFEMPFGKHQGKQLQNIETGYLEYMIGDNEHAFDKDQDIYEFFKKELRERGELGFDELADLISQINGVTTDDVVESLQENYGVQSLTDVDVELLNDIINQFDDYASKGEVEKDPDGYVKLTNGQEISSTEEDVEEAFNRF